MDELIKTRDVFREAADIIDEILLLAEQEETPEVKKAYETALGRFAIKMIELNKM